MTEILAYPLNTASFGKIYYDATDAQTYTCTRLTGVYSAESDLRVIAAGSRNITVTEGLAWLNFDRFRGIATANTVEKNGVVTFAIAPSVTLPRIDRIVVSYNYNDDKVDILLRQGSSASNPQPPAIRRDGTYFEIALADVVVAVGSGNISQANISDLRLNEALCGIMRDGVTGIPSQQLYDQFNSWFNSFKSTNQTNFDDWFDAIKNELEGFDAAAITAELQYIRNNAQMWKLTEDNGHAKSFAYSSLNDVLQTGFYHYPAAKTNKPTNYSGFLRVTRNSTGQIYQEAYESNYPSSDSRMWTRQRDSSSWWSSWGNVPAAEVLPPITSPKWISLPLSSGWYGGPGGVLIYKDPQNWVHIICRAWRDTGDDSTTREITRGVPEGYRNILPMSTAGFYSTGNASVYVYSFDIAVMDYMPNYDTLNFYFTYKVF